MSTCLIGSLDLEVNEADLVLAVCNFLLRHNELANDEYKRRRLTGYVGVLCEIVDEIHVGSVLRLQPKLCVDDNVFIPRLVRGKLR